MSSPQNQTSVNSLSRRSIWWLYMIHWSWRLCFIRQEHMRICTSNMPANMGQQEKMQINEDSRTSWLRWIFWMAAVRMIRFFQRRSLQLTQENQTRSGSRRCLPWLTETCISTVSTIQGRLMTFSRKWVSKRTQKAFNHFKICDPNEASLVVGMS